MRRSVDLSKQTTVNKQGKRYVYWVLRWYDASGKRRSKHLGRAGQLSKRQAENLRRQKESDLRSNPARRNISRAPTVTSFLEFYFAARATELAPGSLELHRQTGRYLQAFFGEHRRLDEIMRHDARAFKTALAAGDLMHANKREVKPGPVTVDLHIRNARTIFNRAVADDLIEYCPFDRLGSTPPVSRDWHYVSAEEFSKLMAAASSLAWQLLLGLGRWAALRRSEALNLRWRNIDWANNRLRVISQDDWNVKDKDARVVPICPELNELLLAAFDEAEEGEDRVIPVGNVSVKNISRDFNFLCKRAGVDRYAKPLHTLRKSCITDWASRFPAHVVKQWAGHSDLDTTDRYYLQVSEAEYERAAATRMSPETTQLPTQLAENEADSPQKKRARGSQPSISQGLPEAGEDGIPGDDARITHLDVVSRVRVGTRLTCLFQAENAVCSPAKACCAFDLHADAFPRVVTHATAPGRHHHADVTGRLIEDVSRDGNSSEVTLVYVGIPAEPSILAGRCLLAPRVGDTGLERPAVIRVHVDIAVAVLCYRGARSSQARMRWPSSSGVTSTYSDPSVSN